MDSVLDPQRQKSLGAFYTPPELASKLVDWCVRTPADTVLDPSFGGSVFLRLARDRLLALGAVGADVKGLIWGIDRDADAVRLAGEDGLLDATLVQADF